MNVISLQNIEKSYGTRLLFKEVSMTKSPPSSTCVKRVWRVNLSRKASVSVELRIGATIGALFGK